MSTLRISRDGGAEVLQCGQLHVSIPSEEWQKEKEKKVAQCRRRANSASSLPVFTGGFRYSNGSGYRRHEAPTAPPAPPRREGYRGEGPTAKIQATRRHGPGEGRLAWRFRGKPGAPYPGFCPKWCPGSEQAGPALSRNGRKPLTPNSLRKADCPGSHGRKQHFFKVLAACPKQSPALWQPGYREEGGMAQGSHRHTRPPSPRPGRTVRLRRKAS